MENVPLHELSERDNWHPRENPHEPREFDEEKLQMLATHVVAVLSGRSQNKPRFPSSELLERLQALKEEMDLAILFLSGAGPVQEPETKSSFTGKQLLEAFEDGLRWIWNGGNARRVDLPVRLAAYTYLFLPHVLGGMSQTALLGFLGIKDKQQFHRYVMDAAEKFHYVNPLMRDEEGVANMRKAAERRKQWEELVHEAFATAATRANQQRKNHATETTHV